jgi:hypothetical protein
MRYGSDLVPGACRVSQLAVEDEVDSGVWLKEAPKKISAGRARSGP